MILPEISVVMPVYNCEKFVIEAVESILTQTHGNLEFIIIDDSSSDTTVEQLEGLKDRRIKLIKSSLNKGNYFCRNLGNDLAKGKYIAVMDADDVSLPERLCKQSQFLEKNKNIGVIGALSNVIDKEGKIIRDSGALDDFDIKTFLLFNNCFTHSTLMYRKQMIKKNYFRYNEAMKYAADYMLLTKFSRKTNLKIFNDILLKYRTHEDQITSKYYREQSFFANSVRLEQLRRFRLNLSEMECQLFLKACSRAIQNLEELEALTDLFNNLLESNSRLKLYHQLRLYEKFQQVLYQNKNNISW